MNTPTEAQQIEALWTAISSGSLVVDGNQPQNPPCITLYPIDGDVDFGRPVAEFNGPTREDVIGQLIAYQVAGRLDG